MKQKPDISKFLAGGDAAAEKKQASANEAVVSVPPTTEGEKITKTIRMTKSMDLRLKDEAHRQTMAKGKRVTESDLIEQALLKYLNK